MSTLQRTRVLHIGKFYPPHRGGMETHLEILCRQLRDEVALRVIVANAGRETREEVVEGVRVTRVGTKWSVAGASVCPGMVRAIREADADIVHIHLPNPTAVLALLASGHRGRVVASYHSDIVRQRLLGRAFHPVHVRLLDRCAAIVAATPNYIESSPVLPAYRDRCRVIPYGISLDGFQRVDESAVAEIRARYGPRIVLGVGRLVYYKGFEYLIEAMRGVDAQLLLIGDGPLAGALGQRARALGVDDRVAFLGNVHGVVPYYQAADVFCLASTARSEAFGIVQLEAMACGVPVVNTALDSGVPFVSLDGETGLTVPAADAGALGGAINHLMRDTPLRERLGEAARARAFAEFNQELMAERMLALYGEVLATARPGARSRGEPARARTVSPPTAGLVP